MSIERRSVLKGMALGGSAGQFCDDAQTCCAVSQ